MQKFVWLIRDILWGRKDCITNLENICHAFNNLSCLRAKQFKTYKNWVAYAVPKFNRELGWVSNFNQSINWHHHIKDYVEIDHLTKYDAFRVNRDQVMVLEIWLCSKSVQTSLILRQRPPKPYKLLKFFMISLILFKMGKHSDFHLSFIQIVGAWQDFTVVRKLVKNFKSLYGFGGRCIKIKDVCMDFEPCFKVHNLVHNLVSVHPKSIILSQMTNLDMIFHVVVSVYRLNLPQFPVKFWNSLFLPPHAQIFFTVLLPRDSFESKTYFKFEY